VTATALLFFLTAPGCTNRSQPATEPDAPRAEPTPDAPASGARAGAELPPAEGAEVSREDGRIVTRVPTSHCIETTYTPLVIGDDVIYGVHKKFGFRNPKNPYYECPEDPTPTAVYSVDAKTGEARVLLPQADTEATGAWTGDRLIQPLVKGGLGFWSGAGATTAQPVKVAMDSPGLWDPNANRFIVGTVNVPSFICQGRDGKTPNPECGLLMAVDADGVEKDRIDRTSGLRAWITAGVTTDGKHYFVGGGAGKDGAGEPPDNRLRACSVVKLSKDLEVLASYDDGDPGCRKLGLLESAPVGEVAVSGDSLWVQYLGSTEGSAAVPIVQLSTRDLRPICRAEIPAPASKPLAGYYQGPVVDAENSVYVMTRTQNGMNLVKVRSDCTHKVLHKASRGRLSSPTLADDRYVLVSEPGWLHVLDSDTGRGKRYKLGSEEAVIGGAVIGPHGVSVVSRDGTLTTLTDTGLKGYGEAAWPRFRGDNEGRAGGWRFPER